MFDHLTFAISSAVLIGLCSAGLQVPLVIINLSPFEAEVDMTYDENCIKHDFNPVDLGHYYDSWESNNLADFDEDFAPYNDHLQQYKAQLGVPKLRGSQASMQGVSTIPAFRLNATDLSGSPYMVFETEMDGSGDCFGSHSGKSFAITVNGSTEKFNIEDPPTSEWTLTMYYPENTRLVLGSGGHASWGLVLLEAVTAISIVLTAGAAASWGAFLIAATEDWGAKYVFEMTAKALLSKAAYALAGNSLLGVADYIAKEQAESENQPSGENSTTPDFEKEEFDTSAYYKDFGDVYKDLDDKDRRACVLGINIVGNYDCLVAGTSLVIQGNGKVVAVPLPNIYRAWN